MELTENKPLFTRRALIALVIPLVIEQLLGTAVGMADTVMVASVGEKAVSSVAIVNSVNNLIVMLLSALATGGAVVVAQYIGRQDIHNGRVAAKQLLYATAGLMAALAAVVVLFNEDILRLIYGSGLDADVMAGAKIYFLITGLSYPFLAVYNACAALFRAMGNSRISMLASLVMNIVNVVGNAILIYIYHWGPAGAAAATLLSRVVAAVLMLVFIQNKQNLIHLEHPFQYKPNGGMIRRILTVGIPSGIENSIFQIGKLFVQSLVASLGTATIAANSILDSLWGVTMVPGAAVNLTIITVVGQCVGAKRYKEAERYTWRLIATAILVLSLTGLPTILFADKLIGVFNLSPEAAGIALKLYPLMIITDMLLWPLSFGIPNALRAADDVRYTMVVAIVSMWIFRVGFSYIFVRGFSLGLTGTWCAMFMDWGFRIICFVIRFKKGKWRQMRVIED